MSWPIEIDGQTFDPIPASWISHPDAADRRAGSPRIYAVSATTDYNGKRLQIRYAHPTEPYVLVYTTGAYAIDNGGVVPAGLVERGSHWPRSIVPRTDPTDIVREPEREHMIEVWGDRVDAIPSPDTTADRQLVADGGDSDAQ
ncbi:hypothetical protein GOC74_12065 [Halomicrobium mukohataei]|uniref:Uncharacterized protein n=1 Tax=Halomicrobium mukohataei TaxID=57705 RepID=A0A847UGG4_9EURY|nr:hypothetical protein [Halomicrobium mukohataei]NLV10660.1 hypothetical protein [Halomicrobium mukohataei]